MLIHEVKHSIRINLRRLFAIAFMLPFATVTTADAAEKQAHSASKHRQVVKKHKQAKIKAAQLKRSKTRPNKLAHGSRHAAKTTMHNTGSLKLAKDIGTLPETKPEPAVAPAKAARLTGTKPSQYEDGPSLQIGKTLYQRNGEIQLRETDNPAETNPAKNTAAPRGSTSAR